MSPRFASSPLTFSRPDAEEVFRAQLSRVFIDSFPPLSADSGLIRAEIRKVFFADTVRPFFAQRHSSSVAYLIQFFLADRICNDCV